MPNTTQHQQAALPSRLILGCLMLCLHPIAVAIEDTGWLYLDNPRFNQGWVTYEKQENRAVIEGDIVLATFPDKTTLPHNDVQHNDRMTAQGLAINYLGGLWPEGTLAYQIDSSIDSVLRSRIQSAVNHWNTFTPIVIVERTTVNASSYPDYVEFEHGSGCASYLGRQGGRQSIWLNANCSTGNVIHELGHALGLHHEHMRHDRDSYIQIVWENIQSGKEHNFQQSLSSTIDYGEYDYSSIMHYGSYFYSVNGLPTILPLQRNQNIGQRTALSDGDIDAIFKLYEFDITGQTRVASAVNSEPSNDEGGGSLTWLLLLTLAIYLSRHSNAVRY